MLTGYCHCGAVRVEVTEPPQWLIDCNCSICRRNGALWALYDAGTVRVTGHPGHTTEYIWGARTIKTMSCRTCGCVTHWESLRDPNGKSGVNMRNFDPDELGAIHVRRFDGAESWSYVGDE